MLKIAVEAALEAGALLKANSGRAKTIERKAGQETNLVTEIDRKAEEIIIRIINGLHKVTFNSISISPITISWRRNREAGSSNRTTGG